MCGGRERERETETPVAGGGWWETLTADQLIRGLVQGGKEGGVHT